MSIESTLTRFGVPLRYARAARAMLGHGTEGAAYELANGRVLKVNVTSEHQTIARIARRVKGRAWANQIRASGRLRPGGITLDRGFWYVSDRLYPLSSPEQRVLNSIGYALMANAKGFAPKSELDATWKQALSLLPVALQNTLRKARAAGYHDLHGRNVMRTLDGAYKVIDVESLRPLSHARTRAPA